MAKAIKPKASSGEKGRETVEQGKRLRLARERAGFKTAGDAAAALKENPVTYRQYENGTRPYWVAAEHFAQVLGVSPAWLLWGHPDDTLSIIAASLMDLDEADRERAAIVAVSAIKAFK